MKILRREHRRRVGEDLDYCIGLLQDIRKVVFKGYNTSMLTVEIDSAIRDLIYAKGKLRKTKLKIEYKHPRPPKPLIKIRLIKIRRR